MSRHRRGIQFPSPSANKFTCQLSIDSVLCRQRINNAKGVCAMIQDLLARYYEACGENPRHKVLRSIMIDGHEVAWMQCDGWFINLDVEGETYSENKLFCECDFTENIGWKTREDGKGHPIVRGSAKCRYREAAKHLRHLELHDEYVKRFETYGQALFLSQFTLGIIIDLVDKAKSGEFIGENGKPEFLLWSGYLYVQTLAKIIGQSDEKTWEYVLELKKKGEINIKDGVIRSYREAPSPTWVESFRVTDDGWIGIASLPAHSRMEQKWKLEVMNHDGTPTGITYEVPINHDLIFGPDKIVVASMTSNLHNLINYAKSVVKASN